MDLQNLRYPLLLDGGLSNQLEQQGCDLNQPLWTAMILKTAPEQVRQAHMAYLHAGSQCIITASYQASVPGFRKLGVSDQEAEELIHRSVEIATQAAEQFQELNPAQPRALVAASVGPYGAFLADGSEYNGNYRVSQEDLYEFHSRRLHILDCSPADLLACETIPSYPESVVLARLLKDCRKKAWITFSCKDERYLRDGTPLERCLGQLRDHPNIFALGINCTEPRHISGLLGTLRKNTGNKRIVVYPNSGEEYHPASRSWTKTSGPCFSPASVRSWIDGGADIVGGCCRVSPEMIRQAKVEMEEMSKK